jgi:von Willebrand factor type A domain
LRRTQLLPLLLLLLAPAVLPADAAGEVDAWREAFARGQGGEGGGPGLERLERLLIDLRGYGRISRPHRERAGRALLDLYGAGLDESRGTEPKRAGQGWALVELAGDEFERLRDDELNRWAAEQVLVVASGNPPARRAAAARLLADSRSGPVRQALMVCARDEDPGLKAAAFEALVGWRDEGVHRLFLQTLWRATASTPSHLLGAAEAHFRVVRLAPDSRTVPVLESFVRERVQDESWRRASLGTSVCAALPDAQGVPLLIAGLETWTGRAQDGRAVKRVEHDLVRELARRSGLDLGSNPKRWQTWWTAARGGLAQPASARAEGRTKSTFFGLQPSTDRLVFVLDRSGSMSQAHLSSKAKGAAPWTRYEEAVDQMVGYLETLGRDARFNLVLFADGASAWRRDLQPADKAHLRSVRGWALRRPPQGGTQLRHGVELGMGLKTDGALDLDKLEADTLVVLCDGQTSDGKNWVLPVLRRVNPRARIVIHGVQIGDGGDGTLELLAETTGGDFVRVQ